MIFFCVHPQPSLFYFFFEYNFTTFCIKPFESSKHVRIFVFRGERMWVNHWITVANWFLNGDDGWSSFGLLRRRKSLVGRRNAIKRTDGQTSTVASSEFVAGSLSSTERCVSHQLLDFFFFARVYLLSLPCPKPRALERELGSKKLVKPRVWRFFFLLFCYVRVYWLHLTWLDLACCSNACSRL